MLTYEVFMSSGDNAEATSIPAIVTAAVTLAEDNGWTDCFVNSATVEGTHSVPLTAVLRWAVIEAEVEARV